MRPLNCGYSKTKLKEGVVLSSLCGILDGAMSIALSPTLGFGIGCSALPVFLYQGAMTVFADKLQILMTTAMIEALSASGGILLIVTGFNVLNVTAIRVENLMPCLLLVLGSAYFWT